jgi:anaerobic ribonucleoside-triphosphate reductase activating protein
MRVGAFEPLTVAMGPGKRACLWVAGCPMRCKGCGTPEFLKKDSGFASTTLRMQRRIDASIRRNGITGVSFSGGEPFAQARAVAEIARHARKRGLSTLSWSGFTREHLEGPNAPDGAAELLAELDVLIDGLFMRDRMDDTPYRGSSNQVIHLLTGRHASDEFEQQVIQAEISERDNAVVIHGVNDVRGMRVALKLIGLS